MNEYENISKCDINSLINNAKNNDAKACYYLGIKYYYGDMVRKNLRKSLKWLERAKELGYICTFSCVMVRDELDSRL